MWEYLHSDDGAAMSAFKAKACCSCLSVCLCVCLLVCLLVPLVCLCLRGHGRRSVVATDALSCIDAHGRMDGWMDVNTHCTNRQVDVVGGWLTHHGTAILIYEIHTTRCPKRSTLAFWATSRRRSRREMIVVVVVVVVEMTTMTTSFGIQSRVVLWSFKIHWHLTRRVSRLLRLLICPSVRPSARLLPSVLFL